MNVAVRNGNALAVHRDCRGVKYELNHSGKSVFLHDTSLPSASSSATKQDSLNGGLISINEPFEISTELGALDQEGGLRLRNPP